MRTHLVQTLIRCSKSNRILLGRWNDGPFQGRISGLLGQARAKCANDAAKQVVKRMIDFEVPDSSKLTPCARFIFHEEDETDGAAELLGSTYEETQFLLDLDDSFETKQIRDEFSPIWFDLDQIPYSEMPEDDLIWYPRVLNNDEILNGTFRFRGTKLLDYNIEEVDSLVVR